ncbi:hypothetical protein Mal64_00270 [Pseudobythopirellula maris]|uniref:DUF4252 domain-containing protein n=1 Tax=Pseudobythopirellula maris TaxID=2527991 RepID=A0A5C5ZQU8_9BACT|nr:DUF4252 domain-containing protein [Pseudobythopirellula maris]TWT89650.1 hypothetical protein Mal64_00270 [Pseudobythopirellula maris]
MSRFILLAPPASRLALGACLALFSLNPAVAAPPGAVGFDHPGGERPKVEVDLSRGLLKDLIGLGDAAIAGFASEIAGGDGQLAAETLGDVKQLLAVVADSVDEVRVRVYDGGADELPAIASQHYATKLDAAEWDSVIRVRDGGSSVEISLLREEGAVRGLFAVVADGNDLVLLNAACDLSPENVQRLSATVMESGGRFGAIELIEELSEWVAKEIHQEIRKEMGDKRPARAIRD